jgi:2-haloalkanoic acid dehalogenase type II
VSAAPVVFDAYCTLFDVTSAARRVADDPRGAALAEAWPRLAADWRTKQLQYTWLRTVAGAHADFAAVTADALDWALEAAGLAGDAGLRARLLAGFRALDPFPEASAALAALRAAGHPLAILSNGSPDMLAETVAAAGLDGVFDALLSVEAVGAYKPARAVYDLASAHFGAPPGAIVFVSSNAWDAACAAGFGFRAVWANRRGEPAERLPWRPAHALPDLAALPGLAYAPEMARFATSDGLSLGYRDEGAGPVLLCLPGLSRNSRDFDPVAAAFAGRFRVLRLDPRGRGGSQRDPDHLNYTVLRETRDAIELLDRLGIARAVVFGASRGGLVALTMAALAPERLAGVILNDVGPEVAQQGVARIMTYLGLPPPHPDLDAAAAAAAVAEAAAFPGVPAETWRRYLGAVWRETPAGLALDYDPKLRDAVIAHAATSTDVDLWPLFDRLAGVPLMLIRGANSDILAPETFAEMRRRRPDAAAIEVADRGHMPFLDEPPLVAALGAFLDAIAR